MNNEKFNNDDVLLGNESSDIDELEEFDMDENYSKEGKKPKRKKLNLKIVIIILIAATIAGLFAWFNSKETEISMDIVDMNSSISEKVDSLIEDNMEKKGVHSVKDGEYTYVLIVSEKLKATEMSINLYDLYKKGFNVVMEYEVEVNEETVSESNPEKVQRMLIRYRETGKLKPVITNQEQ